MKHGARREGHRPHVHESYEPLADQDSVCGVVADPRTLAPPRHVAPRASPVSRLAAALIEGAAADLVLQGQGLGLGVRSSIAAKRNAMVWILGTDAPLTFEWACGVVGLDVNKTRASLLALA